MIFVCAAALLTTAMPAFAQSNPLARFAPSAVSLANGRWNGVDLEKRRNCVNAQNEGTRGTYAQFDVVTDASGTFAITQSGITGLNCIYSGRYSTTQANLGIQGNYSCSDGKQGTFASTAIDVNGISLNIQLGIQLTGSESCTIDAILSMARFYP